MRKQTGIIKPFEVKNQTGLKKQPEMKRREGRRTQHGMKPNAGIRNQFGLKRGQDGFTYIELLTAMFIIALAGGVISLGVMTGFKAFNKLTLRQEEMTNLLVFQRDMSRLCDRIEIPYWYCGEVEEGAIPFYKGTQDSIFRINQELGEIDLQTEDFLGNYSFKDGLVLSYIRDTNQALLGIACQIDLSGKTVKLSFPFSGKALYGQK